MTWPNITITQLNTYGGVTRAIERCLLFVGSAGASHGEIVPVTQSSDMDTLFGADECLLKHDLRAFFLNAGQNAFCYVAVLPVAPDADAAEAKSVRAARNVPAWVDVVRRAQDVVAPEGVIITDPVRTAAEIEAAQQLRTEINNTLGRWVWFSLNAGAIDPQTESWAQYTARLTTLQKGIVAPQVMLVPEVFGYDQGGLAGRLCNAAVTIADSPARVATGALMGLRSSEKPRDVNGVPLDLAVLQALAKVRYSVPMWYADYDGLYWADGVMLEVEGGDYSAIEHVRVADKAARRIRVMAIPKIADRVLNSTPGSIAAHEMLFGKPLREMAKSVQINNVTFPGEVRPPRDGDITISWPTREKVAIHFIVRPYSCPKEISIGIQLDTNIEEQA